MNFENHIYLDELRKADAVFQQSVTNLSESLGLNVGRVSRAFEGKERLGKKSIEAIAAFCGVNPLYLELRLIERQIFAESEEEC